MSRNGIERGVAQKGRAPCGEVSSGLGARAGVASRPKLSGQGGILIDRSLNGTDGATLPPYGLLQTLNRLRRKVALAGLDVDPSGHVFDEQEPPVDFDVVGEGPTTILEISNLTGNSL